MVWLAVAPVDRAILTALANAGIAVEILANAPG